MITRIEAYHYRCFQKLDIALESQHVFAGSNGSGKTTLLDIPSLFSDLVSVSDINDAFFAPVNGRNFSRAVEASELIHKLQGDNFYLVIEAKLPKEQQIILQSKGPKRFRDKPENRSDSIRYELAFKIVDHLIEITEEHLMLFNHNNPNRPAHGQGIQGGRSLDSDTFPIIERNWRQKVSYRYEWQDKRETLRINFALEAKKTALGAMPADAVNFPAAFWFLDFLKKGTHCYEPQWSVMRQASSPKFKDSFTADGSSLAWQVLALQENDVEGLEQWIEIVRMALPNIANIKAKTREDDGYCYLLVTFQNKMQLSSSNLSHGTLHILALTLISFINNPPQIITLEEPENGIHPKAIEAVLEGIKGAGQSQLFLSTHSPIVLANTDLDKIITMSINSDGASVVLKGNEHPALKEWQGEIDLGSLFAAGVFE
ncbi:MAG: AAA family ATPase [Thiotrichaceae bacterium]|nr:AAA family ATPase [Thiotrichaceae bacterium]